MFSSFVEERLVVIGWRRVTWRSASSIAGPHGRVPLGSVSTASRCSQPADQLFPKTKIYEYTLTEREREREREKRVQKKRNKSDNLLWKRNDVWWLWKFKLSGPLNNIRFGICNGVWAEVRTAMRMEREREEEVGGGGGGGGFLFWEIEHGKLSIEEMDSAAISPVKRRGERESSFPPPPVAPTAHCLHFPKFRASDFSQLQIEKNLIIFSLFFHFSIDQVEARELRDDCVPDPSTLEHSNFPGKNLTSKTQTRRSGMKRQT